MQDAKRIQDQVSEMAVKAQARLEVARTHHDKLVERCKGTEALVAKFKFLHEGLCGAENMLRQRRQAFEQSEQEIPASVFKGLDEAIEMFKDLQRQAKENVARNEGRLQAERQLEEELRNEMVAATSRERGVGAQGERAVEVAARRGDAPAPVTGEIPAQTPVPERPVPEISEDEEGDELPLFTALGGSAKEPIAASRKRAGSNGSPPRETEH